MAQGETVGYPIQAAIGGLINALLQMVQAFGVNITREQDAAITGLVNSAFVVLMMWLSYRRQNRPQPPG